MSRFPLMGFRPLGQVELRLALVSALAFGGGARAGELFDINKLLVASWEGRILSDSRFVQRTRVGENL